MRISAILAALLSALLIGLYASVPIWLEPLARSLLPAGYELELRASRPTPWQVTLDRLRIADRERGWELTLEPVVVNWKFGTHQQIEIANAELDLSAFRPGRSDAASSQAAVLPALPALPFESLTVHTLEVSPPKDWLDRPLTGGLETAGQRVHVRLATPWQGAELALDATLDPRSLRASIRHGARRAAHLEAIRQGETLPFDLELETPWLAHLLETPIAGGVRLHGVLEIADEVQVRLDSASAVDLAWNGIDLSASPTGPWRLVDGALLAPSLPLSLALGDDQAEARITDLELNARGGRAHVALEDLQLPSAPELAKRARALHAHLAIEASQKALSATLEAAGGPAARARVELAGTHAVDIDAGLDRGWLPQLFGEPIDAEAALHGRLHLGDAIYLDAGPGSEVHMYRGDLRAAADLGGRWAYDAGELRIPPLSITMNAPEIGSLMLEASDATLTRRSASARFTARGNLAAAGAVTLRGAASYDLMSGAARIEAGTVASARPSLEAIRMDGVTLRLLEPSIWQGAGPLSSRIELSAEAVRIPELTRHPLGRFAYRAMAELDPRTFAARLRGAVELGELRAHADTRIDPASGDWRVDFRSAEGSHLDVRPLADLVSEIEPDLQDLKGALQAHGTLSGRMDGGLPTLDAALQARQVSFRYAGSPGGAEQVTTHLAGPLDGLTIGASDLRAGHWASGAPITDAYAHIGPFPLAAPVAEIDASLATLGGRAAFTCPAFDFARVSGHCHVELQGMELEQVVALEQQAALEATGIVTGALELGLEAGTPTLRGQVRAEGGGHLVYHADSALRRGANNAGLGLALAALENFSYSDLNAALTLDESGRLNLEAELAGSNPDVEGGREIRFNLNVDNEGFWQALQITLGITDNLERKLKELR